MGEYTERFKSLLKEYLETTNRILKMLDAEEGVRKYMFKDDDSALSSDLEERLCFEFGDQERIIREFSRISGNLAKERKNVMDKNLEEMLGFRLKKSMKILIEPIAKPKFYYKDGTKEKLEWRSWYALKNLEGMKYLLGRCHPYKKKIRNNPFLIKTVRVEGGFVLIARLFREEFEFVKTEGHELGHYVFEKKKRFLKNFAKALGQEDEEVLADVFGLVYYIQNAGILSDAAGSKNIDIPVDIPDGFVDGKEMEYLNFFKKGVELYKDGKLKELLAKRPKL